jgi:hypothetical protein
MLPENDQLIRLKPELIQEQVQLAEPAIPEPNIPDMRQLLYWNPLVTPAENIQVKGTASSVCGHFKAIVRGRLKDGTLIFAEKYFEVK